MNPRTETLTFSTDQVAVGYPVLRMLPTPNSIGAPFFDGKNVTKFLENLSDMYDDAGIKDEDQKVKRLARYCGSTVGPWVKTLIEFHERNWEELKAVLLQQFKETDDVQIRSSTGFLEQMVKQPRGDSDDLALYCQQFQASSRKLVEAGRLSPFQECQWFVAGLPVGMHAQAARIAKILDDESTPDMAAVVNYVLEENRSQSKVSEVGRCDDNSYLVEGSKSRMTGGLSAERRAGNMPLVSNGAIIAPMAVVPAVAVNADNLIELSTDSAHAIAWAIMELANAMRQSARPANAYEMRPRHPGPAKSRNDTALPANLSCKDLRETQNRKTGHRNICEKIGPLGHRCPVAVRLQDEGRVHRSEQGEWCGVSKGSQTPPIPVYCVQELEGLLKAMNQYLNTVTKEPDFPNEGSIPSLSATAEDKDEENDHQAQFKVATSQVARAFRSAASDSTVSRRVEKERKLPAARAQRRDARVATKGEKAIRDKDSQEPVQKMEGVRPTAAPEVRANANLCVRQAQFGIPQGAQELERIMRSSGQEVTKLAELVLKAPVGGSSELTVEDVLAGSAETRMLIFSKKRWEDGQEGRSSPTDASASAADSEVASMSFLEEDAIRVNRTYPSPEWKLQDKDC